MGYKQQLGNYEEKKREIYIYRRKKSNNTPGELSGVLQQCCVGLTAIAHMVW